VTFAVNFGQATDTTLSSGEAGVLLGVMIGGSLLAGLIIMAARSMQRRPSGETQSVVRSWLAVTLVLGLLSTCAAAFQIDDGDLRNMLLGGLVASTGAATAFYFSSKGADEARADILKTTTTLAQGGTAPTRFTDASPAPATEGADYAYRFAADGTPPITFRRGSGDKLPTGLDLDLDGRLHGKPTAAGSAKFTVVASNAYGSVTSSEVKLEVKR